MALTKLSSPHAKDALSTTSIMRWVVILCIPGLAVQTYFFGWGNLHNVLLCCIVAVLCEAAVMRVRQRPVGFYLKDYSALVTAVLLGLALPPLAPWWICVVATSFAIIFGKHLYGGMGYNPFNPAMVGYALVLVSFPVAMTTNWATPSPLLEHTQSISDTLSTIWQLGASADAYTGATPLDVYKHEIKANTEEAIRQNAIFGDRVALGWEWVNLAFMLGGLGLLVLKIIPWQTPLGVIAGIAMPAILFSWDADQAVPLSLHLFAGATMLGAFFIATDPVSSSTTPLGRLIYGFGIGLFTFIIRKYGSYPDAIAFAVLLMNFAAPFIDTYTQPRTYGHRKATRGYKAKDKG
jgi:H+/Na+-translocating ferredoxin:NAD+ oxidoreductase subunit D